MSDIDIKAGAADPEAVGELWRRVSSHLDRALELDTSGLAQWLARLDASNPELAAELRELLALHAANCASGFMERSLIAPETLTGQRIGPYTVEQLLGRGGMGSVWLGRRSDGKFEGVAAIKLLERYGLGPDAVDRVRHEASLLARLSHPHIARLFDAGVREDGQPYLILEYIEGLHIDRYCNERKLLLKDRLRLFCDVLDAVAHAHSQLVVHRDLKPSNVLVTADGVVKLLDFGVAVIQPEELQRLQSALLFDVGGFTPAYAAPEQIRGEPVSTAADVYSLGVLLHVLVTGAHPRASIGSVTTQLEGKTLVVPPSLRIVDKAVRRRVSGDLDAVIAHALEDDPARRYANATELAADVRAYLQNLPVRARPATRAYLARKFVQRHRAGTLAALLMGLVLIGASVLTTLQMLDARRQRSFALRQLGSAVALNEFSEFVIGDAGPSDQPMTVLDILAHAEHLLENQHLDVANRVTLQANVGGRYEAYGYHAAGIRILSDAYRLSRQVSDPGARARAACSLSLAVANESPSARSSQLIEEGLGVLPHSPEYALDRVYCLQMGSESAKVLGDTQLAIWRAESAAQALKEVPFGHDLNDLRVYALLPEALGNAGRYREALPAFADLWRRVEALGRQDTLRGSVWLNNWGVALIGAGRPLDAEARLRRAVQINAAAPGRLDNYAGAQLELGRVQEAEDSLARAYSVSKANNNSRFIARDQVRLARIYREKHNLTAAAQMLDQAEATMRQIYSRESYEFATVVAERALIASDRGEYGVALNLMGQAMQICEQAAQHGHPGAQLLPDLLGRRAMIELGAAAYPVAEADARKAIALLAQDAAPGDYSSYGGRAHLVLARALSAQGKPAEARQEAQEAARQLEKAVGPDHPDTRAAREMSGAAAP